MTTMRNIFVEQQQAFEMFSDYKFFKESMQP